MFEWLLDKLGLSGPKKVSPAKMKDRINELQDDLNLRENELPPMFQDDIDPNEGEPVCEECGGIATTVHSGLICEHCGWRNVNNGRSKD